MSDFSTPEKENIGLESELMGLVSKYGLDAVTQKLSKITGEQGANRTESTNKNKISELLSQNGVPPYYLQTVLQKGDQLLGRSFQGYGNSGYEVFYGQKQVIDEVFAPMSTNISSMCSEVSEKMRYDVDFKDRGQVCIVGCINGLGAARDKSLLTFDYSSTRKDPSDSRDWQACFGLLIPQTLSGQVINYLREANPNETLTGIQRMIDPELLKIAPAPQFKKLIVGFKNEANGSLMVDTKVVE